MSKVHSGTNNEIQKGLLESMLYKNGDETCSSCTHRQETEPYANRCQLNPGLDLFIDQAGRCEHYKPYMEINSAEHSTSQ